MRRLNIALEAIEELIKEKKELLNSEHYSVRYSGEIEVDSLNRVKTMLAEKLEEVKNARSPLPIVLLGDKLCNYCEMTNYGSTEVNTNEHNICEGKLCKEAYASYLEEFEEQE